MMSTILDLLAQAGVQPATPIGPTGVPVTPAPQAPPEQFFGQLPLDDIWRFIVGISWLHAVLFVATGVIYLLYGWRLFKALVVINFAVIGMFAGMHLGRQLGSGLWGGIIGTALLSAVSWPLMKYAVSVLGACAGAVIGGALWRVVGLPDQIIWCGALAGLIGGGLLAFSSYSVSIMLFSSLQGAAALAVGILALLNAYPNLSAHMAQAVYGHTFLLPSFVLLPTAAGLICQRRLIKNEADWAMPE